MTRPSLARRVTVAVAVPLFVVSAAACGGGEESTSGGVPAVSWADGKKPKIDKGSGAPPEKLKVKVLEKGQGRTVQKSDFVTAHYAGQTWQGKAFDDSYQRKKPSGFPIGVGGVIKGWDKALVGKTVGSRVEMVVPPGMAYGNNPPQGSAIGKGDTLVFSVEIKDSVPMNPSGKKIPQNDEALPEVSTNLDAKAPEITIPEGRSAPGELVSKPVIKGTGEKVGAGDTVLVNYKLVEWKNPGRAFSTWEGNPQAQMPAGPQEVPVAKMPGWKEGLAGQTVGSRVLLVVPKSAFPEKDQKQATDVVMAVDIMKAR